MGSGSHRAQAAEQVGVPLLLALGGWVAQFHHLAEFGLYEDDYFFIGDALGRDPAYLAERLKVFLTWPQGRPIGFFLPSFFAWLGDHLGGLTAIYLLGFLVVVLNSYLFYRVARLRLARLPALAGAFLFLLFPADTTKILLTHDFQLQPSLTFLLAATLIYASGRKPLAYLVAIGSALTYESVFVLFFAIPVLTRSWDRRMPRELARHIGIVVALLLAYVVVRLLVGEQRAVSTSGSVSAVLPTVALSLVRGPVRALLLFLYGPLRFVRDWDRETVITVLGSFAGLALLFWRFGRAPFTAPAARDGTRSGLAKDLFGSNSVQVFLNGAVLLVLAYGLAFTHYPPDAVFGRSTSVHLAATVGAALMFGALAAALLQLAWRFGAAPLAACSLAAYLALDVGYYVTIQRDFARSWQEQRAFWAAVLDCCPDLASGTILLNQVQGGSDTTFISTNSWADALVLPEAFRFPTTWQTPRLFTTLDWQSRVRVGSSGVEWLVPGATWDEYWAPLAPGTLMLLRAQGNQLRRQTGEVTVAGQSVLLKQPGPSALMELPHGPLWSVLFGSHGAP